MDTSTDILAQRLETDPGILVDLKGQDLDEQDRKDEQDLHLFTVARLREDSILPASGSALGSSHQNPERQMISGTVLCSAL